MKTEIKKLTIGKYYILKKDCSKSGFNIGMRTDWGDDSPKKLLELGRLSENYISGKFKGVRGGLWDYNINIFIELTEKEAKRYIKKLPNEVYFGIEIECLFNENNIDFEIGSYHNGEELSDYWETQTDSSLYSNGDGFRGLEFVSKKCNGEGEFNKAISDFIINFGHLEIGEDFYFNKSCGCHIHIGFNKGRKVRNKIEFSKLKEVRETFFKLLKESIVLSDETKTQVKAQYYRSYAKKVTPQNWLRGSNRSSEFNLQSEGNGLEWRSFNLCGVNSWEEFREMFKIAKSSLNCLIEVRFNGYEGKFKNFGLTKGIKETIKDSIKEINNPKNYNISNKGYILNIRTEESSIISIDKELNNEIVIETITPL